VSRATQQNYVLILLLKDLSLQVNDDNKAKINVTLKGVGLHTTTLTIVTNTPKVEDEVVIPTPSLAKTSGKRARKGLTSSKDVVADLKALGDANALALVGLNKGIDLLGEDLL
jgi:hypothetical protein